jgi:hypothetical protein
MGLTKDDPQNGLLVIIGAACFMATFQLKT